MLVNSHTAGDPKPEGVNVDGSKTLNKKKRKSKKPKTGTDESNAVTASTVNKENNEVTANPSEIKKKKKRNTKKTLTDVSEEKSENLISVSFQASKVQCGKNKKELPLNGIVSEQNKGKNISQLLDNSKKADVQKNAATKAVTPGKDKQNQPKTQIKSTNKSPPRLKNKISNEVVGVEEKGQNQQKKKNSYKNKKRPQTEEGKGVENKVHAQKITNTSSSDNSQKQKNIAINNKRASNEKLKSNSNIKPPPGLLNKVSKSEETSIEEHTTQPKKKKSNKKKKKNSATENLLDSEKVNSKQDSKNLPEEIVSQGTTVIKEQGEKIPKILQLNESSAESVCLDECDSALPKKESTNFSNKIQESLKTASVQVEEKSEKQVTINVKKECKDTPTDLTVLIPNNTSPSVHLMDVTRNDKSREDVLAAREAKRLAKLQAKKNKTDAKTNVHKEDDTTSDKNAIVQYSSVPTTNHSNIVKEKPDSKEEILNNENLETLSVKTENADKSREAILAEREAKKLAKKASKLKGKSGEESVVSVPAEKSDAVVAAVKKDDDKTIPLENAVGEKKKPATKAERRAIQEAQRAAKAKFLAEKQQPASKMKTDTPPKKDVNILEPKKMEKTIVVTSPSKPRTFKVKLFNHLQVKAGEQNLFVNNQQIHPVMVKLGEQYAKRTVVGSNARCLAFLDALKTVIQDYETPPKKEFARGLEASVKNCVDHLQKCRPLAVSVYNAYRYIKMLLTKLPPNQLESDVKKELVELIDNYVKDQIEKAAQGISYYVQGKITNGDVILTYGCSSLINYILEEAHSRQVNFRVVIVDSRPYCEGQELLRRLVAKGISCTCVLINAVGFIMPEVTKVLLGAHALLANGFVMSRTGTAQVALVAKSFNVPVLVCCETHKFSERVQTDAIVYNELGDPNDLISKTKDCRLTSWKSYPSLYPLNLNYDVTPPELVTAVVTEIRFLPCTSAPVILRIRPSEMVA